MTSFTIARLSSMLLAVCTPWLVTSIVLRVAAASAGVSIPRLRALIVLRGMTLVAAGVVAIAIVTSPPTPWVLLVAGVGFGAPAVVALRVLGEIDELTRPAREVKSGERAASLRPRQMSEYLPWSWRMTVTATAVLGATAFVVRASHLVGNHRMFVPVLFAAAALVFMGLYEVWTYQVISGPIVAGDAGSLRRIVRRIFAMELLLVVACSGAAHALLGLNWDANGTFGAAIAVIVGGVGVAGCALALASGLVGRRYETVER
jgi:hypothetical protein